MPSRGSGLVAAEIYIRRGSADEQPGEIGLASFTASMLKRGTDSRSSARIAFELESLGAMAGHGAGVDASSSSIRCAVADLPKALETFFDCLRRPAFDAAELETEREALIAYLRRIDDDKFDLTYHQYVKRIFAGHGYGHIPDGEIEDVEAITAEKCRAWHAKTYLPENMLIVAAGDFDPEEFCALLEPYFAGWPVNGSATPRYGTPTRPPGKTSDLKLEKELEQGFIVLGYATPGLTHADHPALRLAAAALGEGFCGRLFTHLRDERSLAYAVGGSLSSLRLGGHQMLYIGTEPGRLDEAREGLFDEAEHLRRHVLDERDLSRALHYIAGKYVMRHQSLASRAGFLASWEDIGAGAEYDDQYLEDLKKVTGRQVLEAAERWWVDPTVVILRPEAKSEKQSARGEAKDEG